MISVESHASSAWLTGANGFASLCERAWINLIQVLRDLVVRLAKLLVWLGLTGVIGGGWWYREQLPLQADSGLGYALGIFAVTCMLLLLIYPLRKRLRFLRFIGPTRNWFFIHMTLGVTAPIAALYHCGFQLGSLNSQIALACALIVAGSGLVGRFLYRNIYADWSGKRAVSRRHAQPKLFAAAELQFLGLVKQRLGELDKTTEAARTSLATSLRCHLSMRFRTHRERRVLHNFCAKQLAEAASRNPLLAREKTRLARVIDHYVADRTLHACQVARIQVYERLFALWHIAHLPFFVLLLFSVIAHVFAVHLY